ncbi:MAG: helix-turn-helix domain-containing protein, partial [bacterium]|nr:helix-turn-helix domain-containing protein [bacterium]
DGKRQVQVALKKDYVRCFFEDNENNIWMGTRGNGLKRFRNPVVKTYTMDNGLPSGYIHSLLQAGDGTIWVATNTSLNRYRDGQFRIVENAEKDGWYSLCEDMDGNIWAGSRYGLFKNPTKERLRFTIKDGLPSDAISTLYCDGSNRIWISTTWGIARYAGGTITSLTKAGGMPGDVCNGFYEDKNHDILATASEGMLRLPKGEFPAKGAPVDIPGLTPSFVFEDKDKPDVLWAGTYIDGLQRFADGKWFSFKDAAGLVTNQFYQAVEDDNGYFWFTTNRGILRINKQGLEQFAEGKANWINCTSFNLKDGMLSLECSLSPLNSILKTRSGEYWFATTKGISVLNPSQIKIDTKPPNVILESIKVNREKIISNKEVTQLREVKEIAFQFTAPSFSSPTNTRFRYRMVGIDQKWQTLPPGARREVRYYDLPFGNYRFQVIACNKDSVWNTKGASVAFTVTAPFYASLWFWILILGIVVGFAVAVFLWFQKNYSRNKAPAVAYEGTKLDAVKSKKVMKGLIKLMEMEKAYQDEDLSLGSLAKQLNVTVHFLSQLINEKMGENFFDMVNRYRVEEVKTRLCDPADADTSIMEISYDAGFSAKSSFNRYFKKITGTTPSVFRRNNLHSK